MRIRVYLALKEALHNDLMHLEQLEYLTNLHLN